MACQINISAMCFALALFHMKELIYFYLHHILDDEDDDEFITPSSTPPDPEDFKEMLTSASLSQESQVLEQLKEKFYERWLVNFSAKLWAFRLKLNFEMNQANSLGIKFLGCFRGRYIICYQKPDTLK